VRIQSIYNVIRYERSSHLAVRNSWIRLRLVALYKNWKGIWVT